MVIGAGAAGLMCAAESGRRGRSVLVMEHSEKPGKKIRVSGGGRCNFTNLNIQPEHYLSQNPHFCRSALARFTPGDFVSLLHRHHVRYYEKEDGQLFCERSSAAVTRMLERECAESGAEIAVNCRIGDIKKEGVFTVWTNHGRIEAESLVIATGGLSYPELGASDRGYRIARRFGINVTALRPGLVPLIFSPGDAALFRELSGISLGASIGCRGKGFSGNILITHRGLSGPALLQISSYWTEGDVITIDLLPGVNAFEVLRARGRSRVELCNLLAGHLPRRFARAWCDAYAPSRAMLLYSEKELEEIAHRLHHWELMPAGKEGYGKAEVTLGGVDTEELSSKTMEAKKVPGLYFAGEVIDVTGQLGGYNLHWAWASGFVAGQYA